MLAIVLPSHEIDLVALLYVAVKRSAILRAQLVFGGMVFSWDALIQSLEERSSFKPVNPFIGVKSQGFAKKPVVLVQLDIDAIAIFDFDFEIDRIGPSLTNTKGKRDLICKEVDVQRNFVLPVFKGNAGALFSVVQHAMVELL